MHGYLKHLANFARIVEAGSMKSASELLGTAPSGLSDSVRILETRIGAPLLVRHRHGVTPTSEGERIYAAASGIVDLLTEALGPEEGGVVAGPCRLSVPTEVAETIMADGLRWLSEAYPALEVTVFAEDEIVDHSRFGRDFFLRISDMPQREVGLRQVWAGETRAILVAAAALVPEAERDTPEAIAKLPAIRGPGQRDPRVLRLQSPEAGLRCAGVHTVSTPSARLSFARQGLGVTPCLAACAAPSLADGTLAQVLPDRLDFGVSVRLLTPHHRPGAVEPVIAALCARLFPDHSAASR